MKEPKKIGALVNHSIDPILKKQTGISTALMGQWSAICGKELASYCAPLELKWPHSKPHIDTPFKPATLILAANGIWALKIQHQTHEILEKVNAFFGYHAVERIVVRQHSIEHFTKPVRNEPNRVLAQNDRQKVETLVRDIKDVKLRRSFQKLGEQIIKRKPS